MSGSQSTAPVMELRVALTTAEYERLVAFYSAGLGLTPDELWTGGEDRALILGMGQATLEIFDEDHARIVDEIEAGGQRGGRIRFALRVPDLRAAIDRLVANGATLLHEPVVTPWNHYNARLRDPDGLHVTLFQVLDPARS